jgi:hypothetical protein
VQWWVSHLCPGYGIEKDYLGASAVAGSRCGEETWALHEQGQAFECFPGKGKVRLLALIIREVTNRRH